MAKVTLEITPIIKNKDLLSHFQEMNNDFIEVLKWYADQNDENWEEHNYDNGREASKILAKYGIEVE